MSVVNKMLQDLEARKAEPEISADYQEPSSKRAMSWLWLPVMVIIVVAIWYGYNVHISSRDQALQLDHVGAQQPPSAQQVVLPNAAPQPKIAIVQEAQKTKPLTNLNNTTDTQLNNSIDTPAPAVEIVKSQPSLIDNQTTQTADLLVEQQNNPSQLVANSNTLPVKVKSSATGNDLVKSTAIHRQEPVHEAVAVKNTSEIATKEDISQQIQVALKRGDDRSAIDLLEKLLVISPNNLRARKRLAAMQFSQGEHDKANSILQTGIELEPDNRELRLMQARLYVQMKNPDKAHELLANYAITAEQSVDFVSYRAALAQRVARFSDAQKDYFQLTQNQPSNAKWWLGLAVAEERLGNNNVALDAYQNAKQLAQLSLEVDKFVDQRIQYLAGAN